LTKRNIKRYRPIDQNAQRHPRACVNHCGSYGKIGCSVLIKGLFKTGCGLVTAFVPKCGYQIMQMAIPEVMVLTDIEKNTSTIAFDIKPQAVGIGPNGQEEATQKHCMNS
jgi:NAD(P)H-hydrate repair Nnr-like enzyme with NAD(P)H-hydrate dehydratase domain